MTRLAGWLVLMAGVLWLCARGHWTLEPRMVGEMFVWAGVVGIVEGLVSDERP